MFGSTRWQLMATAWSGRGPIRDSRLRPHPAANGSIIDRVYTTEISSGYSYAIDTLFASRTGHLWVGSRGGAAEWTGGPRHPFRRWAAAEGVTDRGVNTIG